MSHIIIIRGEQGSDGYNGTRIDMQWEPPDSMSVEDQVQQYRKMLKLYLKARHVADPDHSSDPGE